MDQDKPRAVPDQSEGKEQGGEVLAGEMVGDDGLQCGDASPEKEDATAEENAGHGDAAAEDLELIFDSDAWAEESEGVVAVGDADDGVTSGNEKNEDHGVPKNPLATRFRFRAAIAHPTPPTTYRRLPLRSRKQYNPTRFVAEGTASATAGSAGVASALSTSDSTNEAQSSTVARSESDATVDQPSSDGNKSGIDAMNAPAAWESSSHHLPSRGRKQRRPEQFIPEEAESSVRAKARRTSISLDRILTSLCVSPERRPEWVGNATADDVGGRGQGGVEGPETPDGRARVLGVVAVLGASLALCVVACVLFYVIGRRTEHGPSDGNQM